MNFKDFYREYIKPHLDKTDRPKNRLFFSCAVDNLHRGGLITDKQAQNWVYPSNRFFVSDWELKRLREAKKAKA